MERKVVMIRNNIDLCRSYFFLPPTLKGGKSNQDDTLKGRVFLNFFTLTSTINYVLLNSLDCARLDSVANRKFQGLSVQLSNLDILLKFSLANLVYSLANFAVKLLELRIFIEIFLGELSVIPLRTLRLNFWNLKYKLLHFHFFCILQN